MQSAVAHRRPVRCLDEPAVDTTGLHGTPGVDQKQPRVLTDGIWPSIPDTAMLPQKAEPGSQHGQIRLTRAYGTHALHEAIPLVQRDDQLTLSVKHQAFVARAA